MPGYRPSWEISKGDSSPAKKPGLQYWDKIVKVDSTNRILLTRWRPISAPGKIKTVALTVERKGSQIILPVKLENGGKWGIAAHQRTIR